MKSILLFIFLSLYFIVSAQSFLIIEKKGKFGTTDLTGKKILPCKYDSVKEIKIKSTTCIKAWSGGQFSIFNLSGKGDDKNPINDFVAVSVYPNNEYIFTQTGGNWYRTLLSGSDYDKDLSLKIPDSLKGFASWENGKRGIYDYKNGVWIIKPEYDNIIFPFEGNIAVDSIVANNPLKKTNPAWYYVMNTWGSVETNYHKLENAPLITVKNKRFELTGWDGTKLLNGISYDSLFYSNNTNCFYGLSANGISCISISGKIICPNYKFSQVTGRKKYILISDSAKITIDDSKVYSSKHRIVSSSENDTNRLLKLKYPYERVLNITSTKLGIYDVANAKAIVQPKYSAFFFYWKHLKEDYTYSVPFNERKIEYMDTLVYDKISSSYVTEKGKREVGSYGDLIYFKKDDELVPLKMAFSINYFAGVNLSYPFWGLTLDDKYELLDTLGQKIEGIIALKVKYISLMHHEEFYLIKNVNGTHSLINLYGKNMLKEKEYILIEEKEKGFNVQIYKDAKVEFIKFVD